MAPQGSDLARQLGPPWATLPVGARPAAPAGTGEAVLPLLHLATSDPKEFALEPEWPLVCPSPAGCQAGMIQVPRKERGSEQRGGVFRRRTRSRDTWHRGWRGWGLSPSLLAIRGFLLLALMAPLPTPAPP